MAVAAGIGLASNLASSIMSFSQASKEKKAIQEAEMAAARALEEAKKKLEVNVFKGLAIAKEPYELEREALISAGAQAIQAGQEAERGAAATAGRIQMAQQESQAGVRSQMAEDLFDLEKLTAQEESRLIGERAKLDLAEAEGAQMAAAQAANARQQAISQGASSIGKIATDLASFAKLYSGEDAVDSESSAEKKAARDERKAQRIENRNAKKAARRGKETGYVDYGFDIFSA